MPLIERYVLRRTTWVFLLTLAALVGTIWVTQVLRELDVVTAKGQTLWVLFVMTVLALPALLQVIAPVAFLAGCIIVLNTMNNDSDIAVVATLDVGGQQVLIARNGALIPIVTSNSEYASFALPTINDNDFLKIQTVLAAGGRTVLTH